MVEFYTTTHKLYEQLGRFRGTHQYKHLGIGGIDWKYITCGQGKEALLLLPGTPGLGEIAFQQIEGFEQAYRVISVNYPATITTAAQLGHGITAILAAENISRVHVEGGSYGGMVAQWFVLHYPNQVETLILSHTGVPVATNVVLYTISSKVLSLLPLTWIHVLARLVKHIGLSELTTQRAFWNAYFDEVILVHSKAAFISRTLLWVDLNRTPFTPDEIRRWHGRVLIIEADNDSMVSLKEREALKALYPQARIHTLHGAAHSTWFTRPEEFHQLVNDFLQEKATTATMNWLE